MPKLPVLSGKELVRILTKKGFQTLGQKGSHVILMKIVNGKKIKTVVPMHPTIKIGTLLSILRQAEINRDELEN
ncbi:MAG: type II toxin-antitoxin system HicA family toxin [archaeon]